jgi:23S rRNA (guanosine2251-2'-O)-methyltransferase
MRGDIMRNRPPSRHSPRKPHAGGANRQTSGGRLRLFGHHAVLAALANPARYCHKVIATAQAFETIDPLIARMTIDRQVATPEHLASLLSAGSVHQGMVLEVEPLDDVALEDVLGLVAPGKPLLLLDQVTDPQNIGAILRSAAAFNVAALITQDRHSPTETGALAKAASGALELVPWARVVNLARALEQIAEAGAWRIGLTGEAKTSLASALPPDAPLCLVMGAEGAGLRPNVASHCDVLARLPIAKRMESLNVSNATAIALYEATRAHLTE